MPISYTAIVLTQSSHDALISLVPAGWDASKTCHHCTLNMGPWKGDPELIGQKVEMTVEGFASDGKVCAVSVTPPSSVTTKGPPHVTVATTNGGKPFLAGKLDFSSAESPEGMPQTLTGIIKEVEEGDYSLATDSEVREESRSISLSHAMVLVERWQKLAGLIK